VLNGPGEPDAKPFSEQFETDLMIGAGLKITWRMLRLGGSNQSILWTGLLRLKKALFAGSFS